MIDHFVKYWVSKPSERALNIKWSTFILDKKTMYVLKDSELDDVLFLKTFSRWSKTVCGTGEVKSSRKVMLVSGAVDAQVAAAGQLCLCWWCRRRPLPPIAASACHGSESQLARGGWLRGCRSLQGLLATPPLPWRHPPRSLSWLYFAWQVKPTGNCESMKMISSTAKVQPE